jgi:hypothetical protein
MRQIDGRGSNFTCLALLQCIETSGTTGGPLLVAISHEYAMMRAAAQLLVPPQYFSMHITVFYGRSISRTCAALL